VEPHRAPDRDGVGVGTVVIVSGIVSSIVSMAVALVVGGVLVAVWADRTADDARDAAEWEEPFEEEAWEDPVPDVVDADPEEPIEGVFPADDQTAHLYRFRLPEDTVYVRADLTGGDVDLDLRVTFGEQEATEDDDWRVTADGSGGDEYAWLARHDDPDFARKPYMVKVDCYAEPDEDAEYELELTLIRHTVSARLAPGESAEGMLSLDTGHRAAYEIVMPANSNTVRVDLANVRQDLDLAADVRPVLDAAHAAATAMTGLGREGLVLDRGELRLDAGEQVLHVTVVERGWNDREIPFEIVVTAGREAPEAVRRLPDLPDAAWPEERAAQAVVGLIAGTGEGSGVVVGPQRRILTAAHVVDEVELGEPTVIVLVATDLELEPVELLRGEVIRFDEDLDLAIIEVVSTLHGDPLPDDWKLPAVPVAWDQPTVLGRAVHSCGYPVLHNGHERAEITWTSGVLSGYERPHGVLLLRHDAEVSAGSSGGALLNERHQLIGITTAMHGDLADFSATGLALPLSEFPSDWLDLLR
jgi:S1-C subfamily serine protease